MKKYALLILSTLFLLAVIFLSGQAVKSSILKVDVVKIRPATVENSVICTGKVESDSDTGKGVQVRLNVDESQISNIEVGQPVQITGVGFKSTYDGTVEEISPDAKQLVSAAGQETVVEVLVSVNRTGSDIKPGFTAKAKITTSRDRGVLVVPYEAVKADKSGREFVYRLLGRRVVKTPIATSREYDDGFQVVRGLSANDLVIENQDNLTNGEYAVVQSMEVVSSVD